jgi:acetolactate synthase-1/3 small subunit
MKEASKRHTVAVLVENRFGVLVRVAGLFSARGYNIESLSVGQTQEPGVSRITIVTTGDDLIVEQIIKQLHRLIDIIKIIDLTGEPFVDREMVLIKVSAGPSVRAEVLRIADIFRAKIVDVSPKTYTIEVTGDEGKIQAILELLRPLGVKEIARTGKVAISRGNRTLSV